MSALSRTGHRIDLDGYRVVVSLEFESGGPGIRRGYYVADITPVLTNAQDFQDCYGLPATAEGLAAAVKIDAKWIEACAREAQRVDDRGEQTGHAGGAS